MAASETSTTNRQASTGNLRLQALPTLPRARNRGRWRQAMADGGGNPDR